MGREPAREWHCVVTQKTTVRVRVYARTEREAKAAALEHVESPRVRPESVTLVTAEVTP